MPMPIICAVGSLGIFAMPLGAPDAATNEMQASEMMTEKDFMMETSNLCDPDTNGFMSREWSARRIYRRPHNNYTLHNNYT